MKKLVAILLVFALLAAGGFALYSQLAADHGTSEGGEQPVEDEPLVAPVLGGGTGLARFETQKITWTRCGTQECSTVLVPMDYAAPQGRTIELALLRNAASRTSRGALVVNPGGPGGSGKEYAQYATMVLGATVARNFDVIGVDPRGVGDSTAIDCLSDDELDAYLAGDSAPDDAQEIAALQSSVATLLKGCRSLSGDLVDHVTTVEAARDMDVVRSVLGEEKLHYFGASYGTKLGATYAHLFPQRVGTFVLDGAMDPTLDTAGVVKGQAGGFQVALRAYAADYVGTCQDDCPLGTDVAQVLAGINQLLQRIDRAPLEASGRTLTIGNAFYGVIMPLYNQTYWPMLTSALEDARAGDGTGLMSNADLYSSRSPSGYLSNSVEANMAINCADDSSGLTPAQVTALLPEFEAAGGELGKAMAWGMLGCVGSDLRPSEKPPVITGAGAGPILVVGTTRDPATPYAWSVALAKQLESAVLLTRDGDGHTGFQAGDACVDDTVEQYLLGEKTPTADVTC